MNMLFWVLMNGAVAVFERSEKKISEFSDKSVKEYKGLPQAKNFW